MYAVTPGQAVELLNDALLRDKEAMEYLIGARIPCNAALSCHPTIQVGVRRIGRAGVHNMEVGMLGIINGIFGARTDGRGFICAVHDEDGGIKHFALTP